MFSHGDNIKTVDVFVTLIDGRELYGALACGLTGKIDAALNADGHFIELHDQDGDATFLAKHQIAILEKAKNGKRKQSNLQAAVAEHSNWHEVLGVSVKSTPETVKSAYHALAKQYHPDCYPTHMPDEMRRYASDRFSEINKAYDEFVAMRMAA